jgi:hypothetical protein
MAITEHFGQATMRGRGQHNRSTKQNLSTKWGIYIFFFQFIAINRLKSFTICAKSLIYRIGKEFPYFVDNFVNYYLPFLAKPQFSRRPLDCRTNKQ